MPYYECPKCGGGYVIDVPPSARPVCDRDGARLKKTSDACTRRTRARRRPAGPQPWSAWDPWCAPRSGAARSW